MIWEHACKVADSILFLAAGLLLAITSLLGLTLALREKIQTGKTGEDSIKPFLTHKKSAIAFYNVLSMVYDVLNPHLYTPSMRQEITEMLENSGQLKILDVGCGTGYTTWGLLSLYEPCEVTGIDQNLRQLKRATKKLSREKTRSLLIQGDAENLPFRDERFDAAISVGAIEYFPHPEVVLKEMKRITKQGGKVVIAGPERKWFKKLFLHKVFYAPDTQELKKEFLDAGLQAVTTELTGPKTIFGTDTYVTVVTGARADFSIGSLEELSQITC